MKIVINGDFYDHKTTGVQRFAYEIIRELDNLYTDNEGFDIDVLMPLETENVPQLKNLNVVKYGKRRRFLWQQLSLMEYCKENKAICVCMCTNVPLLYAYNSIQVIHDAATLAHPEFYSKKFIIYNRLFMWSIAKKLRRVVTVSFFSKDEINKYSLKNKKDIDVIYNAADHIKRICPDETILEKFGLKKGEYCYTLSSLSPNKNFKWIIEVAKNNKRITFVVSGLKLGLFSDQRLNGVPENVIFTGYVSDPEMISLIKNCKIFLFPTLYEGFGITPLEALTLGKQVVVSDTPCMREIYGKSVSYIDPQKYDYNIETLISTAKVDRTFVINKYAWKKSAKEFLQILREENSKCQ